MNIIHATAYAITKPTCTSEAICTFGQTFLTKIGVIAVIAAVTVAAVVLATTRRR